MTDKRQELKLKQEKEREERILKRIKKLKERKGYYAFSMDFGLPERTKQLKKHQIEENIKRFELILPKIKILIKSIKKDYVPVIWEQNAITAAYLLTAKAYGNLESLILFAKQGRNFEIIELARSGQESLDLAFLFLEDGQDEKLKEWFKGKIISNWEAREALNNAINSQNQSTETLPMYDVKTYIYNIYSGYTHSSYAALLDAIDVFHEGYDFEGISGYHYTLKNLDIAIDNLVVSLLLCVKNVYLKQRNPNGMDDVDNLLKQMGNQFATPEEIATTLEQFK